MREKKTFSIYKIAFIGVMAAVVCVVTFFRFPFLGSKVHFANAMCLLSGLLFGPVGGGLAAGLGSAIYDAAFGGYDVLQSLITFVSKFLMAFVCALIARTSREEKTGKVRLVLGTLVGALTYVALYMLKSFVFKHWVDGIPMEGMWLVMSGKLIPSLINAAFGVAASIVLYAAIAPALKKAGLLKKLQ